MTEQQNEETFVNNPFGTVTSKRVIYYRAKGWFSGGSREDIPLKHVTSVRLDTSRSILGGILLLFVGFGLLGVGGGTVIVALAVLAMAALLLWGSPAVIVNTAGRDLNAARGLPWQRSEASVFVEALRKQLFHE